MSTDTNERQSRTLRRQRALLVVATLLFAVTVSVVTSLLNLGRTNASEAPGPSSTIELGPMPTAGTHRMPAQCHTHLPYEPSGDFVGPLLPRPEIQSRTLEATLSPETSSFRATLVLDMCSREYLTLVEQIPLALSSWTVRREKMAEWAIGGILFNGQPIKLDPPVLRTGVPSNNTATLVWTSQATKRDSDYSADRIEL